ncbi:PKD domain-containing protein, partial [Candidatus Bipolaricaulota bacterium]|nr:PKD domain-containing protein [Candidatus Bipolaricaulota bacterium]
MMRVQKKARIRRLIIGLAGVVGILVLVAGCWPFNTAPVASFTASALSGEAPLTVNFSAILSTDSDGIITTYEWDFGDGGSGSGKSASHTYAAAGTFTVVLRVTDDNGAQATAQKTITVTAPSGGGTTGGTGPTASFTATPLTGASPLTVTFNASASAYAGHAITYYSWDFGDGVTGTGITTSHTYSPSTTTTYHVVLRIIASDNTEDTATKDVTVTVSSPTTPSTAPTASFTATPDSEQIGPHEFTFDPSASSAVSGHSLTTYVWNFGDQSSQTNTTDATVTHSFYTAQASQSFTVTLTVIDDAGKTDSYSRTVKVKNLQPVAGFEMKTASGTYGVADIEIHNAQTASQTISFQSQAPSNPAGKELWNSTEANFAGPNDSTSVKPGNFETGDKNLSYDPEGHNLNYTGGTWGIISYVWHFGDGTTTTKSAEADGSCAPFSHTTYALGAAEDQKTFTVELEVIDNQGARNTLT